VAVGIPRTEEARASPLGMHKLWHCSCLFLKQFLETLIIQTSSAITCANYSANEWTSKSATKDTIVVNKSDG